MAFEENLPETHPRYKALVERHKIEEGVRAGLTSMQGLIAQGRGEAYDYLFGEQTRPWAAAAIEAAAAQLLLASHPVVSVNGNTTVLCAEALIELASELRCRLEVNLFYGPPERREKIAEHFKKEFGCEILGGNPDALVPGLESERAKVDREGIFRADVVLVPLEDGDRTAFLKKMGKTVIAVDLNPLSRAPEDADISVIDNVTRVVPALTRKVRELREKPRAEWERILQEYDNQAALQAAKEWLRGRTG